MKIDESASIGPARGWPKIIANYRTPHRGRSAFELAVTLIPFAGLWALSWAAVHYDFWWGLLLTIPAAGFLIRLFLIQHDCGHGSFFGSRQANDWVGRAIAVFTLTPYAYWRQTHANHHATSGNLDRRCHGAIGMLTVAEYEGLPPLRRLGYRLYRHPLVMFGLGPAYVFFVEHRLPVSLMKQGWRPWASVIGNAIAVLVGLGVLVWMFGAAPVLIVNVVTMLLAATMGVWLFYVQHQFEGAYWARNGEWK